MSDSLSNIVAGLDGLIGGPLQRINKLENDRRSCMVLLRGGYGSGKTILAAALALGAAEQLKADVAYFLTETLPAEFRAQLQRLGFVTPGHDEVFERARPALRTALVEENLAAHPQEIPGRLEELRGLQSPRGRHTRRFAVMVVDAIDGSRWSATNREAVDGLSKFSAEEGLSTIVTEEIGSPQSGSPWPHVADVVLELSRTDDGHSIRCSKNRFGGPCGKRAALVIGPKGVWIGATV
jgi:KaiC/GvpD/RAD55 family RecA-like ATPase